MGDEIKNMLCIIRQSHLQYSLELFFIRTQIYYSHGRGGETWEPVKKKKKEPPTFFFFKLKASTFNLNEANNLET